MTGFQHLSVRLKILSVAGLGIFLFLAYFLYSYYIAETNIAVSYTHLTLPTNREV